MNLLRNVIRPYLYTRYGFHRITGTGAFGGRRAQRIDNGVKPHWNPLKLAIWKCHEKQFHESSCSVASVVSCINAIRSLSSGAAQPISQSAILEKVRTGHWKERMSEGGYHGRRGLPLDLLGRVVEESIAAYRLDVEAVEVVQTPKGAPPSAAVRTLLRQRLLAFDGQGKGLLIAHFDQGAFVPTLNIPHISPVGGFDPTTGRVTVLDVDPEVKFPYAVDLDTFYKGLSCDYHHIFRAFGYGSGGYVYIRLT